MKTNNLIVLLAALLFISAISCKKKSDATISPLSSVLITNATVNQGDIKVKFQGNSDAVYYTSLTSLSYGGSRVFGVNANKQVTYSIAAVTDTTKSVFNGSLNLTQGGVYSMYLAGQTGSIDTLLIKESLPYLTDSLFGVRVINLSYNSAPISINLAGNDNGSEVSSLTYKAYSEFKLHLATAANSTYKFEVRSATTGTVLGIYTFQSPSNPVPRFKCCTLAWIGNTGTTSGTYMPTLIRLNN